MKFNTPLLLLCTLALAAGPGCADEGGSAVPLTDQEAAERDAAFDALDRIDGTAFREAFSQLSGYTFTRHVRTEQHAPDGTLLASRERSERHPRTGPPVVMTSNANGAFDGGLFAGDEAPDSALHNLAEYLLPDDPAFLSPRHRDAFTFHFLPDTLIWGSPARVIEVRVRPEAGDDQNIQRARYYVEAGQDRLLAMYLERIDKALFFREEGRYALYLRPLDSARDRPLGGDRWVPGNTAFHTRIDTPFRPLQIFSTTATYAEFER